MPQKASQPPKTIYGNSKLENLQFNSVFIILIQYQKRYIFFRQVCMWATPSCQFSQSMGGQTLLFWQSILIASGQPSTAQFKLNIPYIEGPIFQSQWETYNTATVAG